MENKLEVKSRTEQRKHISKENLEKIVNFKKIYIYYL